VLQPEAKLALAGALQAAAGPALALLAPVRGAVYWLLYIVYWLLCISCFCSSCTNSGGGRAGRTSAGYRPCTGSSGARAGSSLCRSP
jgi:hypothetical protein